MNFCLLFYIYFLLFFKLNLYRGNGGNEGRDGAEKQRKGKDKRNGGGMGKRNREKTMGKEEGWARALEKREKIREIGDRWGRALEKRGKDKGEKGKSVREKTPRTRAERNYN